ncbi:ATP-binding protein [Rufibacter sediminis]|nr:PAS domain-containing sensor histidine kinase [Rufibacter sediminis]
MQLKLQTPPFEKSQIRKVESRCNWEKMAELSLDLFCTLDADGFYTFASEACAGMLGYKAWELEGRHYTELLHPQDLTETQMALRVVSSGFRRRDLENRFIHKDGSEVRILWSAAWCADEGLMFCVGRDITGLSNYGRRTAGSEQKPAETSREAFPERTGAAELPKGTEADKTEMEFSELTKDLHRKNSDLQQFTYIVSHNLRSPIANAIGLASMLSTADRNSTAFDRSLSYLRLSLYRMDAVLKDMNTILSIRDRHSNVGREKVEIKEVILQAMSALEEQLREVGATVNIDIPNGLTVHVNKAYLYSIFSNLLSNSIKYRAEGRRLEVGITCRKETASDTAILFLDNGSGFDMEKNRNNVFKLYKRFHAHSEGRGMGLFLVKSHLDSMGGRIDVNSQIGKGTRFLIHLSGE